MSKPCAQCPWRLSNHGKRHFGGFYRKRNLIRLWNKLRNGGGMQSCHLTDPGHPDHVAAGCSPNAKAQECPGSVILIVRELKQLAAHGQNETIDKNAVEAYCAVRSGGLTPKGVVYWGLQRLGPFAETPLGYKRPPDVDETDPEIGLPEYLR